MGTKSFIRELKKNKIRVTTDCEDEEISCVLISYDNQLTYEKISDTCRLLSTKKVDYLATNPDYVCPIEFGYVPDCGAICEMLNHAIKRIPPVSYTHLAVYKRQVFTRYMMLSIENRESRDERSLGELFYIFPMKCLISHGYRFFNYCQGVNFQSA